MTTLPDQFRTHIFADGSEFLEGRLPSGTIWDDGQFEAVWRVQPAERHRIMIHGRLVETPRGQQAYGADYHYTGNTNRALPIPQILTPLHSWVKETIDQRLNGLLLNWYTGPNQYIGQHHDSTKYMIEGTPIITVSFGETRKFRLTLEGKEDGKTVVKETRDFPAPNGTVFVMPYSTNQEWKHGVPKSARYTGRRISVTFRAFEVTD